MDDNGPNDNNPDDNGPDNNPDNNGPNTNNHYGNPREVPINRPKPITGDRTRVRTFQQQCQGYLQLNPGIFTTDDAKVAFVLSYLTDKEALKWKETYLSTITDEEGYFIYPSYKEFMKIFANYFKPLNETEEANNKMITMKQGRRTVEEYVADFRLLASMAEMPSITEADNRHLINYFRQGLHPAINKKIALSDNRPTTISEWAERAVQYDTNYRMTMAMYGGPGYGNPRTSNNYETPKTRDPNAMDIDAMSAEKRTSLMKQGLCFKCEGRGHLARDCKGKKKDNSHPPKRNMKDIHAMLTALTDEEKKELLGLQGGEKGKEKKDKDF